MAEKNKPFIQKLKTLFSGKNEEDLDNRRFFTPLDEAIEEINKRRQDKKLCQTVRKFLNNDIPGHFQGDQPICYLSRHIATPNYETLRFVELAKPTNLPMVIGQDRRGKFVTNNELKLPLGKMPITKGYSHNKDEIIEYFTIINFDKSQGKPLEEVQTKFGINLVEFHNNLLREIYPSSIIISDETEWVDRNFRDNIVKQYEKMLALMCIYGIMFESYPTTERDFVKEVLAPSFDFIAKKFGVKPLIVEHISEELEITRNWNAYPSVLYPFVHEKSTPLINQNNISK